MAVGDGGGVGSRGRRCRCEMPSLPHPQITNTRTESGRGGVPGCPPGSNALCALIRLPAMPMHYLHPLLPSYQPSPICSRPTAAASYPVGEGLRRQRQRNRVAVAVAAGGGCGGNKVNCNRHRSVAVMGRAANEGVLVVVVVVVLGV